MPSTTFDWDRSLWRNPDIHGKSAKIVIAGDWAPIRGFSDLLLNDPAVVYGDLMPVLHEADLRIVNLECPLADIGEPVTKSGAVFKGSRAHIEGLKTARFDVATLANNHVFDYGLGAFDQTRELLRQQGIHPVGAGHNLQEAAAPLVVGVKNVTLGIVNFSEGEDLTSAGAGPGVYGWEVERVCQQVAELRGRVSAVLVICHAGVEYIPFPPPYVAQAFRRIAQAGADLVVGHHPHVPQGVDVHDGTPIAYSLGNFLFYQHTDLLYRKLGYLLRAAVTPDGLASLRLVPYEIRGTGLALLRDEKLTMFQQDMKALSAPLADMAGVQNAWRGFLKHYGVDGFRKEMSNILAKLDSEPGKAAAMFRNRLTTRQHFHHLVDAMNRIVDGSLDDAPGWALRWAAAYFTERVQE